VTPDEAIATIHAGIDAGINFIDTSAYYGKGVSEQIIGQALQNGVREKVILCTKAGRLDTNVFDFSPEGMRACLEGSLTRLGTDHVDILLAHDIEFAEDKERVFTDTAQVLADLKAEGKCRFIGMSGYPLGLLRTAITRCALDVVMSYCHCNLQNQLLLTELLPVAKEHGVGVLNASPLGMGLLTNQGPPPWHPADDEIKALCRDAAAFCRERGSDIAILGMQYCYREQQIPCTVTGTARVEELQTNLHAFQQMIDEDILLGVQHILAPIRNRTWPSGRE
jgi:L-galactose dehydrogenase